MEVAGMAGAQQWQEWPNMWSGVLVGGQASFMALSKISDESPLSQYWNRFQKFRP